MLEEIEKGMDNKYSKYSNPKTCEELDLLVYANLNKLHLNPKSKRCLSPEFSSKVKRQGWRSISFLMNNCEGVLFCGPNTPGFLKNLVGVVRWSHLGGVFGVNENNGREQIRTHPNLRFFGQAGNTNRCLIWFRKCEANCRRTRYCFPGTIRRRFASLVW